MYYGRKRKNLFQIHNQKNFNILRDRVISTHTIIEIEYPDCKNYEGRKIILFKDTSLHTILKLNEIDPHFTDADVPKPFARFEPTEDGWNCAIRLACIL